MLQIEIMKFEVLDIITASVPAPDMELKCICNIGHTQCGRIPGGPDEGKVKHYINCRCKLPDTVEHNFDK